MFGFLGAIISFFASLLGLVPKGPSDAEKLGQAEQKVQDLTRDDAKNAAGDAAARAVDPTPGHVRDPDPFERTDGT